MPHASSTDNIPSDARSRGLKREGTKKDSQDRYQPRSCQRLGEERPRQVAAEASGRENPDHAERRPDDVQAEGSDTGRSEKRQPNIRAGQTRSTSQEKDSGRSTPPRGRKEADRGNNLAMSPCTCAKPTLQEIQRQGGGPTKQHGAKHSLSVTTPVIVASVTIASCELHQAPLHAGEQVERHHAGRPHAGTEKEEEQHRGNNMYSTSLSPTPLPRTKEGPLAYMSFSCFYQGCPQGTSQTPGFEKPIS